jgi:hypothetical protein
MAAKAARSTALLIPSEFSIKSAYDRADLVLGHLREIYMHLSVTSHRPLQIDEATLTASEKLFPEF